MPNRHRYYHGTSLKESVDKLSSGEPLLPLRPEGGSKFARSRAGLVYLTPSFNQAAEYSFMRGRADWPDVDSSMLSEVAHVFEFASLASGAEPDEDELGFAIKVALCRKAGKSHEWSMNSDFAAALIEDQYALDALCAAATAALTDDRSRKRLEHPEFWRGADKTAVGRKVLKSIDADLSENLVELGISVATGFMERPIAAFSLPTRVMRVEDAIELWRLPEPPTFSQTHSPAR